MCLYPEAEEQVSMVTMTLVFPVHTSASGKLIHEMSSADACYQIYVPNIFPKHGRDTQEDPSMAVVCGDDKS